jgi:hypothetical protein
MAYSKKSAGAGLARGVGLGTALGVALQNIGVWLPNGIAIGLLPPMFSGKGGTSPLGKSKEGQNVNIAGFCSLMRFGKTEVLGLS